MRYNSLEFPDIQSLSSFKLPNHYYDDSFVTKERCFYHFSKKDSWRVIKRTWHVDHDDVTRCGIHLLPSSIFVFSPPPLDLITNSP